MKNLKVVKVDSDAIYFENDIKLESVHLPECCEHHYLSFSDLKIQDFDGLEFDLTSDSFFKRIKDYGIELIPVKGWSVKIPGYGENNGYYCSDLTLRLSGNRFYKDYDITECQVITD